MFGHWFVIASQVTVKIFTETPERGRLQLLKTFKNPLGRERKRALTRKKAGVGLRSVGRIGAFRHLEGERHDPHEEAAFQFAREVTKYLDRAIKQKSFETLTVVAEPHFLGKLKATMKASTLKTVVHWVEKDFQKTPESLLPAILGLGNTPREKRLRLGNL